jgi:hypothetical protein
VVGEFAETVDPCIQDEYGDADAEAMDAIDESKLLVIQLNPPPRDIEGDQKFNVCIPLQKKGVPGDLGRRRRGKPRSKWPKIVERKTADPKSGKVKPKIGGDEKPLLIFALGVNSPLALVSKSMANDFISFIYFSRHPKGCCA